MKLKNAFHKCDEAKNQKSNYQIVGNSLNHKSLLVETNATTNENLNLRNEKQKNYTFKNEFRN